MWSPNRRDRFLRSALLLMNCFASIAVVFIYLTYMSKEQNMNLGTSIDDLIQPEKLTEEKCIPVCDSRACVWHANMLLRNMNSTADPCENFDSFLCGGFKEKFAAEEKEDQVSVNKWPMLSKLKDMLDNIQAEPGSASAKMKTVYDSCTNYRSSEIQGFKDFKNFLNNQGLISWPNLSEDFNFSQVSLPTVIGNFIGNGASEYALLSRMDTNEENLDGLTIVFGHGGFELSTEIPREAAISILKYFDIESGNMERIINDHQLVRKSITNLFENTERCEVNCYDAHHVDCSSDDEWRLMCETVEVFLKIMNITSQVNMKSLPILNKYVNFFKNLFPLLGSLSDRSVANFLVLNFLNKYQGEINFYLRLSKLKDKHFLHEEEEHQYEIDRWNYCIRWITKNMKMALANEFLHQYLTHIVAEEIIHIYNENSLEIVDMVAHQKWIPDGIKSEVEHMINRTKFNVHSLSQVFPNDAYLNELYAEFRPTSISFFDNVLKLKRHLHKLLQAINSSDFEAFSAIMMTDFDVQASATGSSIAIHWGMLLPPYYIPGQTSLINHLLQASLVGHELGHNLHRQLRMIPEVQETFTEKQQCIRDQFSRFKFRNKNLNGSLYDVENVPDNIGAALIDKIVEKHFSSQDEIILPGLPYTTRQLLFMSTNQMWCSKSNVKEEMRQDAAHAPSEFRILGVMQNSRGYPEAFHCPVGSFMNPLKKCTFLEPYSRIVTPTCILT